MLADVANLHEGRSGRAFLIWAMVGALALLVVASAPSGGLFLLPAPILAGLFAMERIGGGPPLFGLFVGGGLVAVALWLVGSLSDPAAGDDALWSAGVVCVAVGAVGFWASRRFVTRS